jgi:hypothetical protein
MTVIANNNTVVPASSDPRRKGVGRGTHRYLQVWGAECGTT